MPSYTTDLKTWGDSGQEYPDSYNYVEGEQPVDAWDNYFNHNVVSDLQHLIDVTNNELLARDGSVTATETVEFNGSPAIRTGGGVSVDGNSWLQLNGAPILGTAGITWDTSDVRLLDSSYGILYQWQDSNGNWNDLFRMERGGPMIAKETPFRVETDAGNTGLEAAGNGNVSIPNGDLKLSQQGEVRGIGSDNSSFRNDGLWMGRSLSYIRTAGGGGDTLRVYDQANSQPITNFNEGGNVEIPNGNLNLSDQNEIQTDGNTLLKGDVTNSQATLFSLGGNVAIWDSTNGEPIARFSDGDGLIMSNGSLSMAGSFISNVGGSTDAASGAIRLANSASITARNNGDTADIEALKVDANDNIALGDSGNASLVYTRSDFDLVGNDIKRVGGTTDASSGAIRLSNASNVSWRNSGDTADMDLSVDGSDDFYFYDGNNSQRVLTVHSGVDGIEVPNGGIQIQSGSGISDRSGTNRLGIDGTLTELLDENGRRVIEANSSNFLRLEAHDNAPVQIRDSKGGFNAVEYLTDTSTGTLELSNAVLTGRNGNKLLDSVAATGQVSLSSGDAVVSTGISATDATFQLALGIDDPGADAKVSGRLFWDDSANEYKIEIEEHETTVNPTVNYDVIRVR